MVSIRPSTWCLPGLCPVCKQGSCLLLCACPTCAAIVAVCDEEQAVFPDPRNLAVVSDQSELCPSCRTGKLEDFGPADWQQIQAAGLQPGEYV